MLKTLEGQVVLGCQGSVRVNMEIHQFERIPNANTNIIPGLDVSQLWVSRLFGGSVGQT